MLATRVIPVILYDGTQAVKSINFKRPCRNVGHVVNLARVYEHRQVDELVFLDILAAKEDRGPNLSVVSQFADELFCPFSVGGGIRNLEDVRHLMRLGADKIVLNSRAISLGPEVTKTYGKQAVIASVDVKHNEKSWNVWEHTDSVDTGLDLLTWIRGVEALGAAGELLVQSVDNDGTRRGYDLDLVRAVFNTTALPFVICGGAGKPRDFVDAAIVGASGLAASSIFHFTSNTPNDCKLALAEHEIQVRK